MSDEPREDRPAVLVADDSLVERSLLEHLLTKQGFPVVLAADGHEAVKVLKEPGAPRLIVLDWEMPGPSGPQIARWLRSRIGQAVAHVILLTGRDSTEDLVSGLESGADDFMTKPFRADELLARIRAGVRVLSLQSQLEEKVAHLQAAMTEVRTLRGFIPICMHCRRIRNGAEQWQELEAYIEAHSDASFSHALCDECLHEHYPDSGETSDPEPARVEPGKEERS